LVRGLGQPFGESGRHLHAGEKRCAEGAGMYECVAPRDFYRHRFPLPLGGLFCVGK